jgi:hypothetical protein
MPGRKFSPEVQDQVRQRANYLCEYCHTNEKWQYVQFTIDHIIPIKQSGSDGLENLALACFHCNRYKSNRQSALDPETQQTTALFNPRNQAWADHFIWSADKLTILGRSATARATIEVLKLNRERIQSIREADLAVDRHPPKDDPVLENLP